MTDQVIQSSFNSGEWSPKLYSRVDLVKYRSGAALLQNWFVDYRGGASTRPGTKYILQTKSTGTVRLIPFQASFTTDYVLEFGNGYVRFFTNGAPVLEATKAISAINIGISTITSNAHGYSNGDWVFITGIVGTVGNQLNGNYYIIAGATANTYTLTDLNGVAIVLTGAYTSGGTTGRVYTIASPYSATELIDIKYAQNVAQMILCHPNHPPYLLTLITSANWTLAAITFGATIAAPVGQTVVSTFGAGTINYAYVITAVDATGQESGPSGFATAALASDIRTVAGTNTITWTAVTGASGYNVYRAQIRYGSAVPAGSQFGFIGTCTATTFIDSNIGPDFSQTPPIPQNPFSGSGVASVTVGTKGNYSNSTIPSVSFTGGGGSGAAAIATAGIIAISVNNGGSGYNLGDLVYLFGGGIARITGIGGLNAITSVTLVNPGALNTGATTPITNSPISYMATSSGAGTGALFNVTWGIVSVGLTNPGTGYGPAPTVVFSSGAATATAVLGAPSSGNPTVPGFFQQRLVLAGPVSSPQQFNMSKPGAEFNFDVAQITLPDDAIQGTLVSGKLNTIESMVAQPQGLIMLTDQQSWLINGGTAGAAISTTSITANAQSFNGASGPPPIVATNNILFVQSKGSIVRDLAFSIYTSVYSGMDISAIASHLFYGFSIHEWAWAEEPFKLVWAIRSDGVALTLTYLKEQDFVAWAHHTTAGSFQSVATVVESTATAGNVDAVYFVVQRTINGNSVQYIERLAERSFPTGVSSAWTVDAGLAYAGTATLNFTGAQHLAGATVTGLATDDTGKTTVITPFAMPTNGAFTLPAPASPATGYTSVLIGLGFTCNLQTLPLEVGEPTVQGKVKKINTVDIRVADTLGLSIGSDASHLVPMKDLVIGNVSSMLVGQSSQIVTDLVTGDAMTYLNATFTIPGQYYIQQSQPLPATIVGVMPNFTVGDDGGRRG